MSRVVAARALLILSIALPFSGVRDILDAPGSGGGQGQAGRRPLQLCEEPMRPDLSKDLNANGEAFADLVQRFRDCSARHAELVGWFGEP